MLQQGIADCLTNKLLIELIGAQSKSLRMILHSSYDKFFKCWLQDVYRNLVKQFFC